MLFRNFGSIVISITLLLVVGACSSVRKEVETRQVLLLRLNENPRSLDPARAVDVTEGKLCAKLFSGLVRFDPNLNIKEDLVSKLELDSSGTKYHFQLKENLTFSDGTPIEVEDVFHSWKRVLSPKLSSPRQWVLMKIKGAKAFAEGKVDSIEGLKHIDNKNFEVTLEAPFAPFLSLLTMPAAAILSRNVPLNKPVELSQIQYSGPYLLKKWIDDQKIILEPNPGYFSSAKRIPLNYEILPEDSSAIAKALAGKLDILKVPAHQASLFKNKRGGALKAVDELNTYFLGFNLRKPDVDLHFRKAVSLLIDKKKLVDTLLEGAGRPANSPIPPSLVMTEEGAAQAQTRTDLNKARELFQKSRIKDREVVFLVPTKKTAKMLSALMENTLRKIGVRVVLRTLDWSAYKTAINKGEGDMFFLSWWADYADPENFLYPTFHSSNHGSGGNRVFFNSKVFDDMISTFQEKRSRGKGRDPLLNKMLSLLQEELPWIPLWHGKTMYYVSQGLEGFTPPPMYSMDKGLFYFKKAETKMEG